MDRQQSGYGTIFSVISNWPRFRILQRRRGYQSQTTLSLSLAAMPLNSSGVALFFYRGVFTYVISAGSA
jgi:hypothetical protein